MLCQSAGYLNAQLDGRHLFAGSMTDTAPVDLAALPADGLFGADGAAAFYYRGDGEEPSVRTGGASTLSYGVTADEPGFARLLQALQIVKTTAPTDTDAPRARREGAPAQTA